METKVFENYLAQVEGLAKKRATDPKALTDILQLIGYTKSLTQDPSWEEFFRGESAFYNDQYERALKHYLTATTVPHYQFFCFRASGYVAKARNNTEQAVNFVKKALKIRPSDEEMQQLLQELTSTGDKDTEKHQKIAIGEKEIAELASIFEQTLEEDELFSREFTPAMQLQSAEGRAVASGSPRTETTMHPGSDIFSSPQNASGTQTETLTHRLYALTPGNNTQDSFKSQSTASPLEELTRLAYASNQIVETALKPASEDEASRILERQIEAFRKFQTKQLQDYLEFFDKRPPLSDDCLYVFDGWEHPQVQDNRTTRGFPLTELSRQTYGGFYLRWNTKGIAVNPGPHFLRRFHAQGLSIKDIDAVIVTHDAQNADVKEIYELSQQLNKAGNEFKIIHYYLNPKTYQELNSFLKPNFKQARHTVHNLELFLDSPDVEKTEIFEGIILNYFLTTTSDSYFKRNALKEDLYSRTISQLGIRLDLKTNDSSSELSQVRIGYLSGTPWSPLLGHHLGNCEIIIAGFGNTSPSDYARASYNEDSLGYHGTFSLLEEISPRLCLCTEFGGREGDIRLEAVKKLRHDLSQTTHGNRGKPAILPADTGLFIDLKQLQVECSVTKTLTDPLKINVVKSTDLFGKLLYLSPDCCL